MRLLQNLTLKPWNTVSKHRLSRSHPWNGMGLLPSKVMRRLEEGLLLLKQQSDRLNADGVLYISNLTNPVAEWKKFLMETSQKVSIGSNGPYCDANRSALGILLIGIA